MLRKRKDLDWSPSLGFDSYNLLRENADPLDHSLLIYDLGTNFNREELRPRAGGRLGLLRLKTAILLVSIAQSSA